MTRRQKDIMLIYRKSQHSQISINMINDKLLMTYLGTANKHHRFISPVSARGGSCFTSPPFFTKVILTLFSRLGLGLISFRKLSWSAPDFICVPVILYTYLHVNGPHPTRIFCKCSMCRWNKNPFGTAALFSS